MSGLRIGANQVTVFAVTSRLLQYPDVELLGCLDSLEAAARRLGRSGRRLVEFVGHLRETPLTELQTAYVETFDLRARNCMYLTYPGAGDTRRRGMALWRFGDLYRRHGLSPATNELPDFLPMLLELASVADDAEPFEMLVGHRAEISLLRESLEADGSRYAAVVRTLELALPKPDARVRAEVERMASAGPPEESVGAIPDFRWLGESDGLPFPERELTAADITEGAR